MLAENTNLFTGAELEELCAEAALTALREDLEVLPTFAARDCFCQVFKALLQVHTHQLISVLSSGGS